MRIGTNITALKGHNNLNKVNEMKAKSLEKLTTGKAINSAQDDAAGLSIATKLNSQIRGLKMCAKNIMDGQSMLETAESVIGETTEILQRLRELATQLANDTNSKEERDKAKVEMDSLVTEIDRISSTANFNGTLLLDGSATDIKLQVGPNKGDTLTLDLPSIASAQLGIDALDISDHDNAQTSIEAIDGALSSIADSRAQVGSMINRLSYTLSNVNTLLENTSAAHSRIMDTDMASEMGEFTKSNILSQAGTSMLAQSMQMPNQVLSLLQQ